MKLGEICSKIALDKLGKPGTIVECMVESIFQEDSYGLVGKTYEVTDVIDFGLQLKETACSVIPERFRLISEVGMKATIESK